MTEIRLFILCESMKWTHLPNPGGLYDQHPILLARWQYIFAKRAEYEEKQRKREDALRRAKTRSPTAGRRR